MTSQLQTSVQYMLPPATSTPNDAEDVYVHAESSAK